MNETVTVWEVGGSIRDRLLGVENKDKDFAVECSSFEVMRDYLVDAGFEIFLETPEYLTIRARFPMFPVDPKNRDANGKLWTGDFVMCRKDGAYSDGRRPDDVTPGTILDDLARRDFTVNAMARNVVTGEILDPWGGAVDLKNKWLSCVGSAQDRIREDPLRALRAIRFRIMKGLTWNNSLGNVLHSAWLPPLLTSVSTERIMEELKRCFARDTLETMHVLFTLPVAFRQAVFGDGLWLKPTMEKP